MEHAARQSSGVAMDRIRSVKRRAFPLLVLPALVLGAGCASFNPTPMEAVGFMERAESKTEGDLTVAAVVLSQEEARAVFDSKLYKKKIQPVWLEITNHTHEEMAFLPRGLDPAYFSSMEVAQKTNSWHSKNPFHMLCPCPLATSNSILPPASLYALAIRPEFASSGTTLSTSP